MAFRLLLYVAGAPLLCAVAACGDYIPPVTTGADPQRFAADLDACQTAGRDRADAEVKKRGHTFLTYPVSFPLAERRLITACMAAHGYAPRTDG